MRCTAPSTRLWTFQCEERTRKLQNGPPSPYLTSAMRAERLGSYSMRCTVPSAPARPMPPRKSMSRSSRLCPPPRCHAVTLRSLFVDVHKLAEVAFWLAVWQTSTGTESDLAAARGHLLPSSVSSQLEAQKSVLGKDSSVGAREHARARAVATAGRPLAKGERLVRSLFPQVIPRRRHPAPQACQPKTI